VYSEGKSRNHDFRKEVSGFWKNAPPFAELTKYTKSEDDTISEIENYG